MKRKVLSLTLFLALGGTAQAAPQDDLLHVLNLIDVVPTRAQLDRAGGSVESLLQVARDARLPRYPRARATAMLALYDTPATRTGLTALLDDPRVRDSEVRVQAILAIAHLDGPRAGPVLARWIGDANVQVRGAAARALIRVDPVIARARLAERLQAEPERWLRDDLRRRLNRAGR